MNPVLGTKQILSISLFLVLVSFFGSTSAGMIRKREVKVIPEPSSIPPKRVEVINGQTKANIFCGTEKVNEFADFLSNHQILGFIPHSSDPVYGYGAIAGAKWVSYFDWNSKYGTWEVAQDTFRALCKQYDGTVGSTTLPATQPSTPEGGARAAKQSHG